jgi:hypothetical protein
VTLAAAALALVLLHRADGGIVTVAAAHVTSLRETPGRLAKQVPDQTRCVVGLTDGKFVAVLEPCGEVRKLLEAASRPSSG